MRRGLERLDHVAGEAPGGRDPGGEGAAWRPRLAMSMRIRSSSTKSGRSRPVSLARRDSSAIVPRSAAGRRRSPRVGEGRHECLGEASVARVEFADALDDAQNPCHGSASARAPSTMSWHARTCPRRPRRAVPAWSGSAGTAWRARRRRAGRPRASARPGLPREQRASGVEDAVAVVAGVGAHVLRHPVGHRSHFSAADGGVR